MVEYTYTTMITQEIMDLREKRQEEGKIEACNLPSSLAERAGPEKDSMKLCDLTCMTCMMSTF